MRRKILSEAFESEGKSFDIPSPTRGWNARDNISRMRPDDAIMLDNLFPGPTKVSLREGSSVYATLPDDGNKVESLLVCNAKSGDSELFAATDAGVYKVTSGGTIASPAYVITDGRVESVNINVAGEPWLWCCNGVDDCFLYKSSTDTFQVLNALSSPALTGITSSDVVNVALWKGRILLVKKNSLSFYYLPLNSVGGAAAEYDLGQVFRKGGYLVALANWSVDAGDGPDDRLVAISSEGEVIIYQGTDPSSAADFSFVGLYYIGKPIGKRCVCQIAGDLALNTENGLWPLSKALESSTIDRRPSLTDRIRDAFNAAYKDYGDLFGWQPLLYPSGPALLVNVPISVSRSHQFVMNTITGAWCRFKNWDIHCMAVMESGLYAGASNEVWLCWSGVNDRGGAIVGEVKTAFTYGPGRYRSQTVSLLRPILKADARLKIQMALDTDFADGRIISSKTNIIGEQPVYDDARWDLSAFAASPQVWTGWRSTNHTPGRAFSLRMRISARDFSTIEWYTTDFIVLKGGLL